MKYYINVPSVSGHSCRIQMCLGSKNNEHFWALLQLVFKASKIIHSLHVKRLLYEQNLSE